MGKNKRSVVLVFEVFMSPKHEVCLESNMLFRKGSKTNKQTNRISTFPQSTELGRLYSYSGHASIVQIHIL